MRAAVANQEHVDVAELGIALRAALRLRATLLQRARVPVGTAQRPGHDMLESTEHGPSLPRRLVGAKAIAGLDLHPAPCAPFAHRPIG